MDGDEEVFGVSLFWYWGGGASFRGTSFVCLKVLLRKGSWLCDGVLDWKMFLDSF